jgi:hypothetical protein
MNTGFGFVKLPDGSVVRCEDVIALENDHERGCVMVRLAGGIPSIQVDARIEDVRTAIFGPEATKITPLENAAIAVREATRKHAEAKAAYREASASAEAAYEAMFAASSAMYAANQELAELAAKA